MFLHWLAGMIFIFYLASFVMLLREVLRPGVLWFLRNLNDQNFHPINEVLCSQKILAGIQLNLADGPQIIIAKNVGGHYHV